MRKERPADDVYEDLASESPLPLFAPPEPTPVTSTKIESYERLQPVKKDRQQQVLEALRHLGPSTLSDLAKHLGWKGVHLVSGRITELREDGKVEEFDKVLNPETNRRNSRWKAV